MFSPMGLRPPNNCFFTSVPRDRKSTRLNSSHLVISYAVFCLKKKNEQIPREGRLHSRMALSLHISVRTVAHESKTTSALGNPGPRRGANHALFFFFLIIRRPRSSTLFPNPTLFR